MRSGSAWNSREPPVKRMGANGQDAHEISLLETLVIFRGLAEISGCLVARRGLYFAGRVDNS